MYIILYILLFLLLIATWVLLLKIHLEVDSTKDLYSIHFGNAMHANLEWNEDIVTIHFKVFFYRFTKKINLSTIIELSVKKEKEESKKSRFKVKDPIQKFRKALRSFKVQHCRILMDTDDYYINSLFYPVAYLINRSPMKVHVNYQGINSIQLKISNRPIQILSAIFL